MLRTTFFLSVLFAFSGPASAGLMDLSERDWLAANDGLLTFDQTTGLEWLDLTFSAGATFLDAEASPVFVGNGGDFRWALASEIDALLAHLSWHSGGQTDIENASAAQLQEAIDFIGLLGDTCIFTCPADIHLSQGASRGSPLTGGFGAGFVQVLNRPSVSSEPRVSAWDPLDNCCWSETSSNSVVGLWLVRQAPAMVPEPATLGLMALGLAGVRIRRRS